VRNHTSNSSQANERLILLNTSFKKVALFAFFASFREKTTLP